jgi:Fe-S cluster biogenesis protein NfuA/nitrite reductase/ring-hydroxylating ferredoxin subunit
MTQRRNLREVGSRIEALVEELRSVDDPAARETAEQLVRSLVEFYGGALERIVEMVDEGAPPVLLKLADDPLVASLLVLHGLHPVDVDTRVQRALEQVRPYLGSHAGGVEYLGIDQEGVVRLRLEGSCHGCPSSTVTVKLAIERAIEEAAPEVSRVDVEGVTEPRAPGSPALLQVGPLRNAADVAGDGRSRDGAGDVTGGGGWTVLPDATLLPSELRGVEVEGTPVLLSSALGELYAYLDACPACARALNDGTLEGVVLTCPGCGSRFDVRLAGRSVDQREERLEPLPLLRDGGGVRIAIPSGAAR